VVAAEIGEGNKLRLTDRVMASLPGEYVFSPLEHDASTNLLVRGMDALVVAGEALPGEAAASYLDAMTRRLYNLLWAAYQEQVTRVAYLSTLELMAAYGPEYIVTERWRPRPIPEPHLLGKHLGEYVCREFAREHKLTVVVLRLGTVVSASEVAGQSVDAMWLDQKDLGAAVSGALTAPLPHWNVIHVQGKQLGARFPVGDAERLIGYAPTVDFSVPSHMH
jgi:nucleoside-diphosphate-sugar epimerase